MKKSRILALLLTLTLVIALFAGCAKESAPPAEPEETQTAASEAPPEEPSEAPEAPPEEEAPPAEEPVEEEPEAEPEPEEPGIISGYTEIGTPIVDFKYDLPLFEPGEQSFSVWVSMSEGLGKFMPNGFSDCIGYQESAKLTGVELDFVFAVSQANQEKFNLMIASEDYTDIITNVNMIWTSGYDYAIEEEIFIDLTEMIETSMPVYSALYDQLEDDVKRDLHTDSGNFPVLYSLNYDFAEQSEGPMIRRDYLKKVGLDIPVTYDDWDEVLHAFKTELDLPQPLMLPKGIVHTTNAVVSGFGVSGTFSTFPMVAEPYYQVDGQVKYGVVEPGFKEYMEMIARWYDEGIISSEFMVLNDNPMGTVYTAEISSGNAGIFFADGMMIENYVTAGTAGNPDYDIWAIPDPVKEEGQVNHFLSRKSPISGRLSNISVTTAVEDVQALGKYLDWYFTEEGAVMASGGPEGRAWEYDADGNRVYTQEWLNSEVPRGQRGQLYAFSSLPLLTQDNMPESEVYPVQEAAGPIWEANADSAYVMPSSLSVSIAETEEYTKIYNDIQTYIEENLARFVTGDNSMDEWDAFVAHIMEMGLEDCIAIKQAAVDRYYGRSF